MLARPPAMFMSYIRCESIDVGSGYSKSEIEVSPFASQFGKIVEWTGNSVNVARHRRDQPIFHREPEKTTPESDRTNTTAAARISRIPPQQR